MPCRRRELVAGLGRNPYFEQSTLLSASDYARGIVKRDAERYRDKMQRGAAHERWEYPIMQEVPAVMGTANQSQGKYLETRINKALAYLDTVGFERSKHQRVFHKAFLATSYHLLYGDELHQHLVQLLRENGWSELRAETIAVTPRRFGKTVGVALWAAVLLVVMRNHDISIYSNNQRASKMMLLFIYKIIRLLQMNPEFGCSIVSFNKSEQLNIITKEGYENICYACKLAYEHSCSLY